MRTEGKTVNINFRVTPKFKNFLDELVLANRYKSISEFLNEQIFLRKRELILEKAINESKIITGKEFGIQETIAKAIKRPKDIEGLFPKEKEEQFKYRWAEEIIKQAAKLSTESGFQDDINQLSKDKQERIFALIFETRQKISELNNALYKTQDMLSKEKKEKE